MNQDLPVQVDPIEGNGTIIYATEVIATIVGVAAAEVEGISSMAGAATISELLGGRPKNIARGVKVEVGAEEVSVDVSVIVDYGMPIQTVGRNVQENIRKSIETMTGLHVIKVDVHVLGVSFEKENKELEQGQEVARLQFGQDTAVSGLLKDEAVERPARVDAKVTLEENAAGEDEAAKKRGRAEIKEAAEQPEPVAAAEPLAKTAPQEEPKKDESKPPKQQKKAKKGDAPKPEA